MPELISIADLAAALDATSGELISLVGGGGKTTSLFALGEQLQGTTVMTTTTRMGAEQTHDNRVLLNPSDAELATALQSDRRVLVWHAADGRRALGVDSEQCDRWMTIADNVISEADGSRKRPFKAPAHYEPVVPQATTLLVACIGVGAFGVPIEQSCHRPEHVAAIAKCQISDPLTPARAAAVLQSSAGSRKGLPASARFAVAVHRVGDTDGEVVEELATLLPTTKLVAVAANRPG